MAYKVMETETALEQLEGIVLYIRDTLVNPSAAVTFLNAIARCYDDLERMPQMYELCRDLRLRDLGYRKAVIKNYVMIYRIDEAAKTVYILRFFHGRQDYEKLL